MDASTIDYQLFFESAPERYLALDLDFRILAVSDALLSATMTRRADIVGRIVFEVFPDNPDIPAADGVAKWRASLDAAVSERTPQRMAILKYDIRRPASEGGGFEERFWSPVNVPIVDAGGNVTGILHQVEDVTAQQRVARDLRNIEQRYARAEAGRAEEQVTRLRETFAQAPAMIAILRGPEHVFETANLLFEEAVGGRPLTGKSVADALPEVVSQGFVTLLDGVYASGRAFVASEARVQLERVAGNPLEIRYFSFAYQPLFDAQGATTGVFVHATDVSEHVQARAQLEQSVAENERLLLEARRANAIKDELLGLVSHELRTPLTIIAGTADVLRRRIDQMDSTTRDGAITDIVRDSARLQNIIENMLVLARLEATHAVEVEPILLQRSLLRLAEELRQRHPGRSIEATAELDMQPILAQAGYLDQILENLVSNSIKYSYAAHPIEIEARADAGQALLIVRDRGAQLTSEDVAPLFEPFFRAGGTRATGMGLGLAVCRRLVDVQGGRIWARPRKGGGLEVGFTLPFAADLD